MLQGSAARRCWVVLVAIAAFGTGVSAHAQTPDDHPPPNEIVSPQPRPPIVQGAPGSKGRKIPNLPCGIRGPAVDLGNSSRYPKSTGTLKTAMVFVDFPDSPADPYNTPQQVYGWLAPQAQIKLGELSYGKLKLSVAHGQAWVRMPKTAAQYGFVSGDYNSSERFDRYEDYLKDALRLTGKTTDLSEYKVVYIVAAPGANTPQAATNLAPGDGYRAGKARVEHVVTLNGGEAGGYNVTVHETGHMLGLPDLYEVGVDHDWNRFIGAWDTMGDSWDELPMMSWTRRLVGWMGDKDFRCVKSESTVDLKPVTESRGVRGAIVKLGPRSGYVIEARTEVVRQYCPTGGVLIYKWNGQVVSGNGPIRVVDAQPDQDYCGRHSGALFKPFEGGTSTYKDKKIAVSVLGGDDNSFRVRVQKR